jgi:hypothetical protein
MCKKWVKKIIITTAVLALMTVSFLAGGMAALTLMDSAEPVRRGEYVSQMYELSRHGAGSTLSVHDLYIYDYQTINFAIDRHVFDNIVYDLAAGVTVTGPDGELPLSDYSMYWERFLGIPGYDGFIIHHANSSSVGVGVLMRDPLPEGYGAVKLTIDIPGYNIFETGETFGWEYNHTSKPEIYGVSVGTVPSNNTDRIAAIIDWNVRSDEAFRGRFPNVRLYADEGLTRKIFGDLHNDWITYAFIPDNLEHFIIGGTYYLVLDIFGITQKAVKSFQWILP